MISWFVQDIDFKFKNKLVYRKWLNETAWLKGQKIKDLSVIFCSDAYLRDLNRRFLGHDYCTDVLTFDSFLSQEWMENSFAAIEGDIFVSIDRVNSHAVSYGVSFMDELARVMVHGLLHLLGYRDGTIEEQVVMRQEEDAALRLLASMVDGS